MLGEPLFRGRSRAHFLRAGGVTIGSALIFSLFGCATTAGSASYETARTEYDHSGAAAARSVPSDTTLGLKASVLDRRAYVRAVLERNPSIESARQGWRAALSRVSQSGTFEDPMIDLGIAPL